MMNGMLQTTVGTCVHVQVWTCTGIDQGPQLPRHRGSSARQGGEHRNRSRTTTPQAPRKLSQAEGGRREGGREGGKNGQKRER